MGFRKRNFDLKCEKKKKKHYLFTLFGGANETFRGAPFMVINDQDFYPEIKPVPVMKQ